MDTLDQQIVQAITSDIEHGNYTVLGEPKNKHFKFVYIEVNSLKGWAVTLWEDGYINPQMNIILPNIGEVGTKAYRAIKKGKSKHFE